MAKVAPLQEKVGRLTRRLNELGQKTVKLRREARAEGIDLWNRLYKKPVETLEKELADLGGYDEMNIDKEHNRKVKIKLEQHQTYIKEYNSKYIPLWRNAIIACLNVVTTEMPPVYKELRDTYAELYKLTGDPQFDALSKLKEQLALATTDDAKKEIKDKITQTKKDFTDKLKITRAAAKAKALEIMREVGIPQPEKRFRQYPFEFSGGMRQRIVIAIALTVSPEILICDEPTTALDVTIQAQILKLMNDLQRENGTSIIFITHDLGVINEMADDVVVMYCGQVVEQARARVIFTCNDLSHPYTEGLMYSIPRLDAIDKKLEPIPGVVPHPLALPKGCKFAPRCKYCTEKCKNEEPPLEELEPGHSIRCFYPSKKVRINNGK